MALSCSTSSGKMSNKDLFSFRESQSRSRLDSILKWANISATKVLLLLLVISILMNGIIKGEDVK